MTLRRANDFIAEHHRCRSFGYHRMISYTMPEESGASLRAIGMRPDGMTKGGQWDRAGRPRRAKYPVGPKTRWVIETSQYNQLKKGLDPGRRNLSMQAST